MTEPTDTPTREQIEGADYLELQGMAKAAGLKANESGDELRAALLEHYGIEPQEPQGASEAPEEGDGTGGPQTSQEAPQTDVEPAVEELHTWRAVSNTMTRDGKTVIRAGSTFVATESDPRTRDAVKVEPEGLTDAQLAALQNLG